MKKFGMLMFGIALFTGSALAADVCATLRAPSSKSGSFVIFDGMLYANKPDLAVYGVKPIAIIDRGIWANNAGPDAPPDLVLVKGVVQKIENSSVPIVLDFESFPLTGSAEVVSNSLTKLASIITVFKTAAPDSQIGFYATLPTRDYWRAVGGEGTPKYKQWQDENDKLHLLEHRVDVLFPSLYTFYNDRAGWIKYATAQICEARRMSQKPIYVFLWPEYHDSNRKLAGTPIDPDFWGIQLDTARKYADGVVIWGGYDLVKNRRADWDANAGWWKKTREFMRVNGMPVLH